MEKAIRAEFRRCGLGVDIERHGQDIILILMDYFTYKAGIAK